MRHRKSFALLLLGLITLIAVGCKERPGTVRFMNILATKNDRLAKASQSFFTAIQPLQARVPVPKETIDSAYRELERTLKELKDEMKDQYPPLRSASGSALLDRYREYLDEEQVIFDRTVSLIYQTAIGEEGDPATKWAAIDPLLKKVEEDEKKAEKPLKDAQNTYAKERNITVTS
jgi:hypothetical protein